MFNLKSQIAQKVLNYYFLNPEAKIFIRELSRVLKVDAANLQKKLRELEKEGILVGETDGNQKYYSLNEDYSLLEEVKKMFDVKYGLPEILRKKLRKLKGLEQAYLYGSYAKGQLGVESDIDLLFIGKHSSLDAARVISPLQEQFKREFNVVNMSLDEFEKKRKRKDEFVTNILEGEVIKLF